MNTRITFGPHTISLILQGKAPSAVIDNQSFAFLWPLIQQYRLLSDPAHIKEFAVISNFFWKAGEFQFIESIPEYQKFYLDRVEFEKKNPADLLEYRLTDFKEFDVSLMHPPTIEKGFLYYYTYQQSNWIPYRVVCPFPYHLESSHVHYQVLPIKL